MLRQDYDPTADAGDRAQNAVLRFHTPALRRAIATRESERCSHSKVRMHMKVKRNTLLLHRLHWCGAAAELQRPAASGWLALSRLPDRVLNTRAVRCWSLPCSSSFVFGRAGEKAHGPDLRAMRRSGHFFLKFFDGKSFSHHGRDDGRRHLAAGSAALAPDGFIAVFYTGLGASLLLAGMRFGYSSARQSCRRLKSKQHL